jgi:uncharacterized Tic20 family protein
LIFIRKFSYEPNDDEAEKASNSYLMSIIAIFAGLPLPIVNFIATVIFYLGNKNGTYFVRWHCTQALLSQLSIFFINSFAFWWTILILFTDKPITNNYIVYFFVALIFNLFELIATIFTAIKIRKGLHVEWWLYSNITSKICNSKK